ncbi:hypothetical protein BDF20DRAFT_810491, partial [Mycotypha africana]|uniref:uncharacterized protein n=1 Tax=Mycotypha africana TaxID=64632 RepID=UPI002300EDC6
MQLNLTECIQISAKEALNNPHFSSNYKEEANAIIGYNLCNDKQYPVSIDLVEHISKI